MSELDKAEAEAKKLEAEAEAEAKKLEAEAKAEAPKLEADAKELEEKTKEELLKLAQEVGLEGRSTMNKDELVHALASDSDSKADEGDGSVSEGGDEVRDAQDLLTPTGEVNRGHLQSPAEAKLSAGNPTHDSGVNPLAANAQERKDDLEEDNPEAADLAQEELDFHGPLHLQAPEERIMTGAVSEDHAKEQEKLLANRPDDHVGNVTEAGFDDDGKMIGGSLPVPVVEVYDEEAADTVGKQSHNERREEQGLEPDTDEKGNPKTEEELDSEKDSSGDTDDA